MIASILPHLALVVALLLAALSTSCGVDESSKEDESPEVTIKEESPSKLPREQTEQYQAMYVTKRADMGECNANKQNWLMYVKQEKAFFSCQDKAWEQVEVEKTKIVETTIIEPQYEADFGNMYKDTRTGLTWAFGGNTFESGVDDQTCGEGFRLPTEAEAKEGTNAGVAVALDKLDLPTNFWTMEELSTTLQRFVYTMHRSYDANTGDQATLVCVQ